MIGSVLHGMLRFEVSIGKEKMVFMCSWRKSRFDPKVWNENHVFVFVLAWLSCVGTQVHVLSSWHETSDLCNEFWTCIHIPHDHVHHVRHVLQRETQVFPTLLLNVAIGTTPRLEGVGPRQRPGWYPVYFHETGAVFKLPACFALLLTWTWWECRGHSHAFKLVLRMWLPCVCRTLILALSLHLKN